MSPRLIIAAQAGVVIGLMALALFQARQLRDAQRQLAAARTPPDLPVGTNQRPLRLRLQSLPPINIKTEVHQLNWRDIESPDYATYVANLRGIGCPEATIRDIILADIQQLYATRRRALESAGRDWEFWRHPSERDTDGKAAREDQERDEALRSLDRERRQLVNSLLGEPGIQAELAEWSAEALGDRTLQFLDPEKRRSVAEAIARWRLAHEDALASPDDSPPEELGAAADRALEEALAQSLTPEEREQYELRSSPLSEELRERLRGFGASREEFEKLFRVRRESENELARLRQDGETGVQRELDEKFEAYALNEEQKIKETLGPQRYADFQRSNDADYQTLYSLAMDHSVPTDVANQVWGMRRDVETQTDRIRDNPLLTAEQKVLALRAIRSETESAIVDVLGEPLLQAYQREGGNWLLDLTETMDVGESGLTITPPPLPGGPQQLRTFPVP